MEKVSGVRLPTRTIVFAGLAAAAYMLATVIFAPISYGPFQFRLAGILKPLALRHPFFSWALAVGVALANLASPFGAWDFVLMPIVSFVAARTCWLLRRWPLPALFLQAVVIAIGVAVFPLGIGGGLPVWPAVLFIFGSEATLYLVGYLVLRRTPLWDATL